MKPSVNLHMHNIMQMVTLNWSLQMHALVVEFITKNYPLWNEPRELHSPKPPSSTLRRTQLTAFRRRAAIYTHSSHLEGGFSNFLLPLIVVYNAINQQEKWWVSGALTAGLVSARVALSYHFSAVFISGCEDGSGDHTLKILLRFPWASKEHFLSHLIQDQTLKRSWILSEVN